MIVIGLDGATWSVIRPSLGSLPAFSELLSRYNSATLECDIRPVHSGPSWTTIFSGKRPEEHGITHFVMGEDARDDLLRRKMFIWDKAERAIVMGVPISLPPINVNYQLRDWERLVLSIEEGEMFDSTSKLAQDASSAIEYGEAELVVAVFSETDRAQHLFWNEPEKLLKHYQSVDKALSRLMRHFAEDDFLILSDHGFTSAEETRRNGWDTVRDNQSGGHHPMGIAISNLKPPEKVTGVCGFLLEAMKKKPRI
ncbi:MAG: alkaline phosphatase family protein [Candidatus Paceibacterota bacterium]